MKLDTSKPLSFLKVAVLIAALLFVSCKGGKKEVTGPEVRFASVSWTGVTIKTEVAVEILRSLGYNASNKMVSVPIVYQALDSNEADVFLGNWMPSMETIANKYFKKGSVVKYLANMKGAKYTLAVPAYVYEGGLKHFSDIAKYADKLESKIYGIEEGNDGNLIISGMIKKNMFGLGKFKLVASSETGMLSQVKASVPSKKWVVFLGWSPHSMNEAIDMKYLKGSTSVTFGGNDGTAVIYTNIRKGFDKEQPNVAKFLKNLKFSVTMMNQIMTMMKEDSKLSPKKAGMKWLKEHPEVYRKWLDGVTTADGKPALPFFEKTM